MKDETKNEVLKNDVSLTVPFVASGLTLEQKADALSLPAEFLAELSAEIQADLEMLSIDQLTSATLLLGRPLALLDAFVMQFSFKDTREGDDGQRVVLKVADVNGIVYHVVQSPIGSRLTVVNIFNNCRRAQRRLTLTNMIFKEVGVGKFNNKPIILSMTSDTRQLWQ
jgi:hypothetical protein